MVQRNSIIYDAVEIHTGIAANKEVDFYTTPQGQNATQVTTGTATTYVKSKLLTNNKLAGQLPNNTEWLIKAFDVYMNIVDPNMAKQMFIDSNALFEFKRGDELLFQCPLIKMVDLKPVGLTGFSDGQASAKAQKFGMVLKGEPFRLEEYGIKLNSLDSFKATIKFHTAVTFKKFNFDYGTAAANAAYTTAFNLYVAMHVRETIR